MNNSQTEIFYFCFISFSLTSLYHLIHVDIIDSVNGYIRKYNEIDLKKLRRWTTCVKKRDQNMKEKIKIYTQKVCKDLAPKNVPGINEAFLDTIYAKEDSIFNYNSMLVEYQLLFEIVEEMKKEK
ncbi:unnamed protein product [Schistosoma turkestanicum]|nr:unnamed protein product [Schistosoma turkestanicum]